MKQFDIEIFAAGCKAVMDRSVDRMQACGSFLEQTLRENETAQLIDALQAAVPAGASVGEMIVHQSPELTILFARIPPRFQSGIHNHTVFACIGQLTGEEISSVYQRNEDGELRLVDRRKSAAGEVTRLDADAIHHIENPLDDCSLAIHCYGGDFVALMPERSLWSAHDHSETGFSFEGLIAESVKAMNLSDNQQGLDALGEAIPGTQALIESVRAENLKDY